MARNKWIQSKFIEFTERIAYSDLPLEFYQDKFRFNMDLPEIYHDPVNIILDTPLQAGNADELMKEMYYTGREMKELFPAFETVVINQLPHILHNLLINPRDYKHKIYDREINDFRYYNIPVILKKYRNLVKNEVNWNKKGVFDTFLADIGSMYLELCECKRFYNSLEDYPSYNRVGKNYRILEILHNRANDHLENSIEPVVIAVYSGAEITTLENIFLEGEGVDEQYSGRYLKKTGIVFKIFDNLRYYNRDRMKNTLLVLPGPVPLSFLEILLYPWKEILVLNYAGMNRKMADKRNTLTRSLSIEEEEISITYLRQLSRAKSKLIKDFEKRKSIITKKTTNSPLVQKNRQNTGGLVGTDLSSFSDFKQRVQNLLNSDPDFGTLKDEWLNEGDFKKEQEKLVNRLNTDTEKVLAVLERLSDSETVTCELREDRLYYCIKTEPSGKPHLSEKFPRYFEQDDLIIYLDDEERKEYIEFLEQELSKNLSIDYEIIDYWRETLATFAKRYNTKTEFYDLYMKEIGDIPGYDPVHISTFNSWVRGERTYTKNRYDLYILGKIMEDHRLMEDFTIVGREGRKVHHLHMLLGKRLQKLLSRIIQPSASNITEFNLLEEKLFYQLDKNLFKIISISMPKNNLFRSA
ncbi:MAG: hypothetical protein ACFFD4_19745 [Candidatus Odinarchaeota archaeon]